MYRIAIGADPNAAELKPYLIDVCEELGHQIIDMGNDDVIYANTAIKVATKVVEGAVDKGILLCGTGIGMCIAANKVHGAYAALITDPYSAEKARTSNNTNIACLGAFTIGKEVAKKILKIWLSAEFNSNSASAEKVQRIIDYENLNK